MKKFKNVIFLFLSILSISPTVRADLVSKLSEEFESRLADVSKRERLRERQEEMKIRIVRDRVLELEAREAVRNSILDVSEDLGSQVKMQDEITVESPYSASVFFKLEDGTLCKIDRFIHPQVPPAYARCVTRDEKILRGEFDYEGKLGYRMRLRNDHNPVDFVRSRTGSR